MMGIWFFASAIGEFLAAKIGALMSVPEAIANANNPATSLPFYANILSKIGMGSIAIGLILICFVPLIRRWMADIR